MPKRDIALPPVHNTRAPKQWRIISQHVDFEDKTVLDLGCGCGDLMYRAWADGASEIHGADNNAKIIAAFPLDFHTYKIDIDEMIGNNASVYRWDIIVCFSVLPYLTDPTATLRWICKHSSIALIECQLSGDGPGFDWLKSPQDMRRWLDSIGWKSIQRIGETVVKDRGAKRGIWLCSS
jgi:hypothetical protein